MNQQMDLIARPVLRRPDYRAGRMRADMGIDRVAEGRRIHGARFVTRQAKAAGIIEQTKVYAPCASSNGSPKPMYRRGAKA